MLKISLLFIYPVESEGIFMNPRNFGIYALDKVVCLNKSSKSHYFFIFSTSSATIVTEKFVSMIVLFF